MKKTAKKELKTVQPCTCSTRHKIWGAVALAGLFSCGLLLGLSYSIDGMNNRKLLLGAEECDAIAQEIVNITTAGANEGNIDALRDLNEAYSSGCAGRLVIIEKSTPVQVSEQQPKIMATCSRIEQLLKERLFSEDSVEAWKHASNAYTYSTLAEKGCAENADMYKTLALREIEITTALQPEENLGTREVETVIDAYKKLDMQREAQAFLDKVEKLSEPAIDFILKMEKIINE